MATESQRDGDLRHAEIAEITTDEEFNPRRAVDEDALAELTASVRRRGILQPLLARSDGDGRLQLVAGHRRLAAARAAGLNRVPVLVTHDADQALEDAITENLQRQDLRPVEPSAIASDATFAIVGEWESCCDGCRDGWAALWER
jgi:ParB family chromosome partitioning protein